MCYNNIVNIRGKGNTILGIAIKVKNNSLLDEISNNINSLSKSSCNATNKNN